MIGRLCIAAAVAAVFAGTAHGYTSTVVFLVPHQDDETLSMGAALTRSCSAADRRVVVALVTDGAASAVYKVLQRRHGTTVEQFGRARTREMRAAVRRLCPNRTVIFDTVGVPAGALTDDTAAEVVRGYAAAYPHARFWATHSSDRHPEHAALGRAVVTAADQTGLRAFLAVQSPGWDSASGAHWIVPKAAERRRVRQALRAYRWVNVDRGRYGIGWQSVPTLFAHAAADQRVMWAR